MTEGVCRQTGSGKGELIFPPETRSRSQHHASTIAESGSGLVAAWFSGKREGHRDVSIRASVHDGKGWSKPAVVAEGVQHGKRRHPCWNPVLFQPRDGPLVLFYKVGIKPRSWSGMRIVSGDGGRHWGRPEPLPKGFCGPAKNKPLQLDNGGILCPSSTESGRWRVHFELTEDLGRTWERIGPVEDPKRFGAIQPTLLKHPEGNLQVLCRTKKRVIASSWSLNGGRTWTDLSPTSLPNPNAGIDAVTLRDGRQLLVYNHTRRGRSPLNAAVSEDGRRWETMLVLESGSGEFSYPSVIQASDGLVHVTYTYMRRSIKHVVFDPSQPGAHGRNP